MSSSYSSAYSSRETTPVRYATPIPPPLTFEQRRKALFRRLVLITLVFIASLTISFIRIAQGNESNSIQVDQILQSQQPFSFYFNTKSLALQARLAHFNSFIGDLYPLILYSIFIASVFDLVYTSQNSFFCSFLISFYFLFDQPAYVLLTKCHSDWLTFILVLHCFKVFADMNTTQSIMSQYANSILAVILLIMIAFVRCDAAFPVAIVFILQFFQIFSVEKSFLSFGAFSQSLTGAIGGIAIVFVSLVIVLFIGSKFGPPAAQFSFSKAALIAEFTIHRHNIAALLIIGFGIFVFLTSRQAVRQYSEILFVGALACGLNIFTCYVNQPLFDAVYFTLFALLFSGVSISKSYFSGIICSILFPFVVIAFSNPIQQ